MFSNNFTVPIQQLKSDFLKKHKIYLSVLREDLIHPEISGNKWRKLKYNIQAFKHQKKETIITFGGAFSNHIAATAAVGKLHSIKTIGVIRGEDANEKNPTLSLAIKNGMEIYKISRQKYRNKNSKEFIEHLLQKYPNSYIIPEGGANKEGILGCTEILNSTMSHYQFITCSCGTGATLLGITLSLQKNQKSLGFQILKGENYIKTEIQKLYQNYFSNSKQEIQNLFKIIENFHFEGYAKVNSKLIEFTNNFYKEFNIKLDYIYTAKMFYGIFNLIENNFFTPNSKILAIHTGGIQGNTRIKDSFL